MHRVGLIAAASLMLAGLLAGTWATGCAAPPDAVGVGLAGGYDGGSSTASSASTGDDDNECTGDDDASSASISNVDISSLPSCCTTGAAHCVPSADIPPGQDVSALATCSGGSCVPDSFITSGGAPPPSCQSLNNAAGVCLSVCVPQVAQYISLLPQATCASDERCAPCISPLNNQPTGACSIGKSTGSGGGGKCTPKSSADAGSSAPGDAAVAPAVCPYTGPPIIDPTTLPSCDPNGGAHCLSTSLVPTAEQSQLATCPTGLCVPDSFIESGGNFIPKTCTSTFGAEGRCLDEMIPQVASQLAQLPQDICQTYERCVPCYNPLTGASTGACNLSCDPGPKDPPVKLAQCCNENGTEEGLCIPTTSVPSAEQSNLDKDTCAQTPTATLCVPTEMTATTFTPPACTGEGLLGIFTGPYTGVCLSNCLDFGFIASLDISQGTCDSIHSCAPCTNPITQQPTGAPGCPAAAP